MVFVPVLLSLVACAAGYKEYLMSMVCAASTDPRYTVTIDRSVDLADPLCFSEAMPPPAGPRITRFSFGCSAQGVVTWNTQTCTGPCTDCTDGPHTWEVRSFTDLISGGCAVIDNPRAHPAHFSVKVPEMVGSSYGNPCTNATGTTTTTTTTATASVTASEGSGSAVVSGALHTASLAATLPAFMALSAAMTMG